jgi:hypothetical protein
MTDNIKILVVANSYTAIYTDHIEKQLKSSGYLVEKIDDKDLPLKYNNNAKAPSFFIIKNNKAAYMLPGKRDLNTIVKWIKDSNLI